jgi:hypothetical protein
MSRLVIAEHVGQKNCNGKMIIFFSAKFSTSALKENRAFAYCWQCLSAMIGWSI